MEREDDRRYRDTVLSQPKRQPPGILRRVENALVLAFAVVATLAGIAVTLMLLGF